MIWPRCNGGPRYIRGRKNKLSEFRDFDRKIEFGIHKLVGIDTGVGGKSCCQGKVMSMHRFHIFA
jgi:hypothetical protein